MLNSSITLQSVIDYARTMPDLMPVLGVGGFEQQPALTIANDTIISMLAPGLPWKFNRFIVPPFITNSIQQDYASGIANLGWLEKGYVVDINNTSTPPPIWPIEVVRDIEVSSVQSSRPGLVGWLPNDQLRYGSWKANTRYQKIQGTPSNPGTALLQIRDGNGNFWAVSNNWSETVTTGTSEPAWPSNPSFATYQNGAEKPTQVQDGTVIWNAVNPKGQGFRLYPVPSWGGLYYQVNLVAQARPPQFTSVTQTLDPVPNDYASYFRQGFVAHCYRHSRDPKLRARFQEEFALWQSSMVEALKKAAREREEAGFYPSESCVTSGYPLYYGPAYPFAPGGPF